MTTTDELRDRMTAEVDELGVMPDLVSSALSQGAKVRRRRFAATGAMAGVAAMVGAVAFTNVAGSIGGDSAARQSVSASAPGAGSSRELPSDPADITEADLEAAVAQTFSGLLPERFGDVEVTSTTVGGKRTTRFQLTTEPNLHLVVSFLDKKIFTTKRDGLKECSKKRDPLVGGWYACSDSDSGVTVNTDSGRKEYFAYWSTNLENSGVVASFSIYKNNNENRDPTTIEIADEEAVKMVRSPEFIELQNLLADYTGEHPETVAESNFVLGG
jgi:hypothetical protein